MSESPPTLSDLFRVYQADILCDLRPNTCYQNTRLHARILDEVGNLPLAQLTPEVVRDLKATWRARWKPATVRRYLAALRAPLTVAVEEYGWLPVHPFTGVRLPSLPDGRVRWLADGERALLLKACLGSRTRALYPFVLLALSTGGRKNEVRWLRPEAVDLPGHVVRFEHTKTHTARAVPLVGPVHAVLRTWMGAQPAQARFVFGRPDGQKPLDMEGSWQTAVRRAGLSDFHFHDLRHSCASYLAMSGASLLDIAEVLGHKNLQQTKRYTHLTQVHTTRVLERMTEQFL